MPTHSPTAQLNVRATSATSASCRVVLVPNGADDAPLPLPAVSALALACASGETSSRVVTSNGTVHRRREMGRFTFVDLLDESGFRLQAAVRPDQVDLPGLSLALRPGSRLRLAGQPGRTRTGEPTLFAAAGRLLALPADPVAVLMAGGYVVYGELALESAAAALGCDAAALAEVSDALEASAGLPEASLGDGPTTGDARRAARLLASSLSSRGPRERPPRFTATERSLLVQIGARAAGWDPRAVSELVPAAELAPLLLGALDPERGIPAGLPAAEDALRRRYVRTKKLPQLRWMLHQVGGLLREREARGKRARVVADLGCGKGDLAMALAAWLPGLTVMCVDVNPAAIRDAKARAAEAGLQNVTFECTDVEGLEAAAPRIDALVALHACGARRPL